MIKVIEKILVLELIDICALIDNNSLDKICSLIIELDSIEDICSVSYIINRVIETVVAPCYILNKSSLLKVENFDALRNYIDDEALDVLEETLDTLDDEDKALIIATILDYFRESDSGGD